MELIKTIKAEDEPFEEPNPMSSGSLSRGVYGATFVLIALEDIKVLNTYDNTEHTLIGKGTVVDVKSTDKDGNDEREFLMDFFKRTHQQKKWNIMMLLFTKANISKQILPRRR